MPRQISLYEPDASPPVIEATGRPISTTDYFRLDRLRLTQEAVDTGLTSRKYAFYFDPNLSRAARVTDGAFEWSQRTNPDNKRVSFERYLQDLTYTRNYHFSTNKENAPTGYDPSARSFSGTDIKAILVMPGYGPDAVQAGYRELGELQTISISTMRTLSPVRRLGEISSRSYARGRRTVSGTLVFALLNHDVFAEYMSAARASYLETSFEGRPTYFDQIPPFHIILNGMSEVPRNLTVTKPQTSKLPEYRNLLYEFETNLDLATIRKAQSESKIETLQPQVDALTIELNEYELSIKPTQLGDIVSDLNNGYSVAQNDAINPFITDDFSIRRDEGHVWKATYLKVKYDLTVFNPATDTWDYPDDGLVVSNTEALIGSGGEMIPQASDLVSGTALYENFLDILKTEFDGYKTELYNKLESLDGYAYWEAKLTELTEAENSVNGNRDKADEISGQAEDAETSDRAAELTQAADEYRLRSNEAAWDLYQLPSATVYEKAQEAITIRRTAQTLYPDDESAEQTYLETNYFGIRGQLNLNQRIVDQAEKDIAGFTSQIESLRNAMAKESGSQPIVGSYETVGGSMAIYNVHLFATGMTLSVHDIYTEVMYNYVAEYISPFQERISKENFKWPQISESSSPSLSALASNYNRENTSGTSSLNPALPAIQRS